MKIPNLTSSSRDFVFRLVHVCFEAAFISMLAIMLSLPALLLPPGAGRSALATRSALPMVARRTSVPAAAAAAAAMEVLYDSQCMVCLTNKKLLTWFDRGREKVSFVDIRSKTYNGDEHGGVSFDDAMLHFHTVLEGKVAEGSEAVFSAYQAVGLGWLINVLRLPIVRFLVDVIYGFVSKNRHTISRFMPGGRGLTNAVTSMKDLNKAAQGEGCDDEEECVLPYDDDDDDDE